MKNTIAVLSKLADVAPRGRGKQRVAAQQPKVQPAARPVDKSNPYNIPPSAATRQPQPAVNLANLGIAADGPYNINDPSTARPVVSTNTPTPVVPTPAAPQRVAPAIPPTKGPSPVKNTVAALSNVSNPVQDAWQAAVYPQARYDYAMNNMANPTQRPATTPVTKAPAAAPAAPVAGVPAMGKKTAALLSSRRPTLAEPTESPSRQMLTQLLNLVRPRGGAQ